MTVHITSTLVIKQFLHIQRIKRGIVVIKNFDKINGVLPNPKKKDMTGLISTAMLSFINERVK
jgi:hypothetical protein